LVARPLAGGTLLRPLAIIHRRHHNLSATALAFMDLLRQANGHPPAEAAAGGLSLSGHQKRPRQNGRSRNGAARPVQSGVT